MVIHMETHEILRGLREDRDLTQQNMADVLKNLRKFVLQYKPDVVVPFMTYQCIYTCLALAFTKYPVVVCERNDPSKIDGRDANKLHYFLRDLAFSMAKGAIFQTEGAKKYFSGSIQKKSTVILNPLNSASFIEAYEGEKENRIVSVGRLTEQKNQAMLIKAFAQIKNEFPDVVLEIYGDGDKKDYLNQLSIDLDVSDRVFLMGNVSDVNERIKKARVFAFTSDFEGMPNALAEAMSVGLTCVSTDCSPGGARMLIQDGVNGIITPCRDVDLFADALRKVLSDDQYALSLGRAALNIRESLCLSNIADHWEEYLSMVAQK